MSLFPAYGGGKPPAAATETEEGKPGTSSAAAWKTNKSFENELSNPGEDVIEKVPMSEGSSSSSSSEDEGETPPKRKAKEAPLPQAQRLEFDAKSDGFYVDKRSNNSLRTVSTLTKPTRPRYKRRLRLLYDDASQASPTTWRRRSKLQRYTKQRPEEESGKHTPEELAQLQAQLMDSKVLVQREPQCLEHWLQLHRLLELNLDRANRLAVSEHQLHTLEQALVYHPSNEQLLRLYTETASAAYPASEVAVRLEAMLEQSPFVFTLWSSLIMATQGTMARCNVPDVLRIYEDSMRRMHLGHTDTTNSSQMLDTVDTDKIMMNLFHNCVLFLRQSANNNHVFALLRLALELNFPGLSVGCLEARAADESPLIEFEELVLQSGMPLPEIWTRVERLRQAYNFLPYPQLKHSSEDDVEGGLDPQRCIYSDDVCHYIYPLKAPENRLQLLLLVVQLPKMPLVSSDCLAERLSTRLDQLGDSEAIEMLLAGLADRSSYALRPADHENVFATAMLDLAREMCVTPSFMPHCIGNELYAETIGNLLLKCSEAFDAEEPKRRLFVVLLLRFQRLLIVLHKLTGKLTDEVLRVCRRRLRNVIRVDRNRSVTRFYTELATCEFEILERDDDPNRVFSIFRTMFSRQEANNPEGSLTCPDFMHAYLVFAEMLISRNLHAEALPLLYSICRGLTTRQTFDGVDEVISLQQVKVEVQALHDLPAEMHLEEYFLSNRLLILLRARCLVWNLESRSAESDVMLSQLLKNQLSAAAAKTSERRRFLREKVLELQLVLWQLPVPVAEQGPHHFAAPRGNRHVVDLVELAIHEYPRNLVFLQRWATFSTLQWHKLRARLIRTQAGILSLLHLVIAARCRFARMLEQQTSPSYEQGHPQLHSHVEAAVRNRVLSMFETFLPRNTFRSEIEAGQYQILRRNSLFWRCYLRCLSDTRTSFERSKECLLTALDECPWDKALYMDGAIYVPQELAHLQDVMTEKHLRIYALPEELNILRGS